MIHEVLGVHTNEVEQILDNWYWHFVPGYLIKSIF